MSGAVVIIVPGIGKTDAARGSDWLCFTTPKLLIPKLKAHKMALFRKNPPSHAPPKTEEKCRILSPGLKFELPLGEKGHPEKLGAGLIAPGYAHARAAGCDRPASRGG
jgi:hypothetical protein